jgi:hypothetical protein
MECLGLHNKPKAEVHPGHKLTGPREEEQEQEQEQEKKEEEINSSFRSYFVWLRRI